MPFEDQGSCSRVLLGNAQDARANRLAEPWEIFAITGLGAFVRTCAQIDRTGHFFEVKVIKPGHFPAIAVLGWDVSVK